MSDCHRLSSRAWQAYAKRHQCQYKLWNADEVDTLMKQEAPGWVTALYRNVRFHVQRGDVARFFILFKYGGLYADLDVFPNLEKFPLVPLGLCKMVARSTRKMQRSPEWEIELVVATAGNQFILEILAGMERAIVEKSNIAWYK